MTACFPMSAVRSMLHATTPWWLLAAGVMGICPAVAASSPPAELQATIDRIDRAASDRDLPTVLAAYGPDFRTTDGLTRTALGDALTTLWNNFETVTYATDIEDWRRGRNGEMIVETTTELTAQGQTFGHLATLTATVRSRQTLRDGAIVRQDVLAEQSRLSVGEQPPEVLTIAPDRVRPGEVFEFNAFVRRPFDGMVLVGTAVERETRPQVYRLPDDRELATLPGSGLFKQGKAGSAGDDRWLSAILVSKDGMTVVSQRLSVRR